MKKMKKFTAILLLTLSFSSASLLAYAEELPTNIASTESSTMSIISTYKDDIRWLYKIIDRKLYRRQFNYSTGQWIGDWELVP